MGGTKKNLLFFIYYDFHFPWEILIQNSYEEIEFSSLDSYKIRRKHDLCSQGD